MKASGLYWYFVNCKMNKNSFSEYLILCSTEEKKSHRFGTYRNMNSLRNDPLYKHMPYIVFISRSPTRSPTLVWAGVYIVEASCTFSARHNQCTDMIAIAIL